FSGRARGGLVFWWGALAWLTDNPNTSKTVREIAAIWGWSRSTTHRFLSRDDIAAVQNILSRGTSVGQDAETGGTNGTNGTNGTKGTKGTKGTNGTNGTASEPPEGRVLGRTPSGTEVAAMPVASDIDDGPPIAVAPYSDDFKWEPENGAVIVPQQQAIAVYVNPWGQIVIRAEGDGYYNEDAFIAVSPE